MKRYQIHIANLLLSGFLFPQAANAMHHLLISHSSPNATGKIYEFASPAYDYHNCDYQFNSLKYYLNSEKAVEIPVLLPRESEEKYFYSNNVTNELAFHYSLRGPPRSIE